MRRAAYTAPIDDFLRAPVDAILGRLVERSHYAVELSQRDAWIAEVTLLKIVLENYRGRGAVYFEFAVPRLGKRIDAIVIIDQVVFILEFKVGEREFASHAIDQVCDYALDLKNFHETSHNCFIAPILIATRARTAVPVIAATRQEDGLLQPIASTPELLADVMRSVLDFADVPTVNIAEWEGGRYCPTPTIIEAATALYSGHSVAEISRSDASAFNLTVTSNAISQIIADSRLLSRKSICFVTGVPGAGKTLVGLNIAIQHIDKESDLYSVFLSGNGPLVAILREALARDQVQRGREQGRIVKKGAARGEAKAFIQNVHNFRDDCLVDAGRPPVEHVVLFDEAQRAWNLDQTSKFMRQKRRRENFDVSEPEFLISCLDRHRDWAVIVCLVGGGQEINTGEAGISEWIDSLKRSFGHWHLYMSSRLTESEYAAGRAIERVASLPNVSFRDELHLAVSMRSFRAENVSLLVKQILDCDAHAATQTLCSVRGRYPILLTRSVAKAKHWLRSMARGSERYGLVASSLAQRLKPHAIDVRSPMDPIHWFLDGKQDVRSSYYLEDVATEFHVQGLELDYACITWDADLRYSSQGWEHWSFVGDRWNRVRKPERQVYLKNAYRVLLTRARQGMVIVVPEGDPADPTRRSDYYDATYNYLRAVGIEVL